MIGIDYNVYETGLMLLRNVSHKNKWSNKVASVTIDIHNSKGERMFRETRLVGKDIDEIDQAKTELANLVMSIINPSTERFKLIFRTKLAFARFILAFKRRYEKV